MVASTDIKFYVHTNNNAPQLDNIQGGMIGLLDAVLVNGLNVGVASTLTAFKGEATATFDTAHNILAGQIVKITGATPEHFNGEFRVGVVNSKTLNFKLINGSISGAASGTVNCSLAALGWTKDFSSNHATIGGKRAYRSSNEALTTRPYLRVVDEPDTAWSETYAKFAKVGLVENMTSIDDFGGFEAPYNAAFPDRNWIGSGTGTDAYNGWAKWQYAMSSGIRSVSGGQTQTQLQAGVPTSGARQWFIIGNSDFFYILNSVVPLDSQYLISGCGVIEKATSAAEDNWFLSANLSYSKGSETYRLSSFNTLTFHLNYSQSPLILLYKTTMRSVGDMCYLATLRLSRARDGDIYSGVTDYVANTGDINGQPLIAPIFLTLEDGVPKILGNPPALYWLLKNKPFADLGLLSHGGSLMLAKNVMSEYEFGQVVFNLGAEL